jgi:putative component of toxin-antitoxin plasmid stabilization module
MDRQWTFRALRTIRGNVVSDWLGNDSRLHARVDSYLRRLKIMAFPWPMTYYRALGDGVGEIRIDFGKVEHRLYGFFGIPPETFTIMIASSDKKAQNRLIEDSKKLRKQTIDFGLETEEYIV